MLKRTKGRILLALLVVTGFAGTLKNNTLTSQERKQVIANFKDSRTDILKKIKALSINQLNYSPQANQLSIKDCFYRLVHTENYLWKKFDASMTISTTTELRPNVLIKDEELQKGVYFDEIFNMSNSFAIASDWKSIEKVIADFKFSRTKRLRYLRTTTSDIRNHFTYLPVGLIDNYQLILLIQNTTDRYFQQIETILNSPGFPKNSVALKV